MEYYSHLNGWEHIKVHKRKMWKEIQSVVASVDAEACSGVPYYEGELYNLIRQGRSSPAVPLVIIGIAP